MKIKLIALTLGIGISINAMEENDQSLEGQLLEVPTLRFVAAWQLAQGKVPENKAPAEVLEYVDKIKKIQSCKNCNITEKRLFINLLNNPDIEITKFPELIKQYLPKESPSAITRQKLMAAMLIKATRKNKPDLVELLLDNGADVNAQDNRQRTALILSARRGYKKIVKQLLKFQAALNFQEDTGSTALIDAAFNGHEPIVELLIKAGADLNIQDITGTTALILAAFNGNVPIVELLLAAKANVNIPDRSGETALQTAANKGYAKIVKLLLAAGATDNFNALDKAKHVKQKRRAKQWISSITGKQGRNILLQL